MADDQKFAPESDIRELIRNIVHQGSESTDPAEAEWEGCRLVFRSSMMSNIFRSSLSGSSQHSTIMDELGSALTGMMNNSRSGLAETTCITMSDGTCIYDLQEDVTGTKLNTFRHGAWVARLTAYSKQLTEQRLQRERDEEQKSLDEKRKPFQSIDF